MKVLRISSFILSLLFPGIILAQHEFGKLTNNEVSLVACEFDKDADAVVLFDIGKSIFVENSGQLEIQFTRTRRLKIFNKKGYNWAQVSIPFYMDGYGKSEMVREIRARTYNIVDGIPNTIELDPKTIFTEKLNEYWNLKKFAFPGVQEGSIIEYQYTLITPFMYNLPDWEFQDKLPVMYSAYEVRMVPFYEYTFLLQGASKFSEQNSYISTGLERRFAAVDYKEYIHSYVMKNLPAFGDESFITSIDDYIIKLDFQLSNIYYPNGSSVDIITTWPDLSDRLLKHASFGKYVRQSEKYCTKSVLPGLDLSGLSELDRAKALINYTKNNLVWNQRYGRYASEELKKIALLKTGNSADLNLFLIGLLKSSGINATPVLSSTRNHGRIAVDYPFEHFFNTVLVYVETSDGSFLTDATSKFLGFNQISPQSVNGKGLLVKEKSNEWVALVPNGTSQIETRLDLTPIPENSNMEFNWVSTSTGYDAFNFRSTYKDDPSGFTKTLGASIHDVSDISSTESVSLESPYSFSFKGISEMETFEDKIIIQPFLNQVISENPLKQKTRKYPVDLIYPHSRTYKSTIHIPDGFAIDSRPEDYLLSNSLANIDLHSQMKENDLTIEGSFTFKKSTYSSSEYARIKAYFRYIVEKFNDVVVLTHD